MNIRKITSLTALVSFLVLLLNSVVLYIVPPGRVAYWSDWHLWGLTKTDWGNQHLVIGALFLISISMHIYYNWKPMVSYLKNKARQIKVFTGEFNAACMITLVFTIGAYFMIPPFSWVVDLSETIKNNGAVKYGEPPYGHAELSPLKGFAKRTGLNLPEMMQRLENTGIRFDNENQTLRDIAVLNGITPQAVYAAMKPFESRVADKAMPDKPPAGTGKRSIRDITKEYGLDLKVVIKGLAEKRIQATADLNLRAIAEQNKTDPHEIYDLIRQIAEKK